MPKRLDPEAFRDLEEHLGRPLTEEERQEAARFLRQFERHEVHPRARTVHAHVTKRRFRRGA